MNEEWTIEERLRNIESILFGSDDLVGESICRRIGKLEQGLTQAAAVAQDARSRAGMFTDLLA